MPPRSDASPTSCLSVAPVTCFGERKTQIARQYTRGGSSGHVFRGYDSCGRVAAHEETCFDGSHQTAVDVSRECPRCVRQKKTLHIALREDFKQHARPFPRLPAATFSWCSAPEYSQGYPLATTPNGIEGRREPGGAVGNSRSRVCSDANVERWHRRTTYCRCYTRHHLAYADAHCHCLLWPEDRALAVLGCRAPRRCARCQSG